MRFSINNNEVSFTKDQLPMMIHGKDGLGGSHFSISLIAYFLKKGEKIVFLTLLPGGTDSFVKLCSGNDLYILEDPEHINDASTHQAVLIKSGHSDLCEAFINQSKDIDERIIFIKNAGSILNQDLFEAIASRRNVILSGDFTESEYLTELSKKEFITKILFSELEAIFGSELPSLEKYEAFIATDFTEGIISLDD